MKILVISLLRIGDILMITPVFQGLKKQYPDAEIHLLLNRECAAVTPLLMNVDRFWYFERKLMQEGLGEPDVSILESYKRAEDLITNLNNENFAFAVNLTHNRLSGWLAGLLNCELRAGLGIFEKGNAAIASDWFRYLNEQSSQVGSESFHFADVFFYGSGLQGPTPALQLQETDAGRAEADVFGSSPKILVQALTSEKKKNWGLNSYFEMLKLLSIFQPGYEILLLGAPFEKEALEKLSVDLNGAGVRSTLAICSLDGAYSLLKRAKLLISGDTSIKHMAAAAGCRVLEISLGSSQFQKTGIFAPDNMIVQSKQACAPCPHSTPCSRQSHACAEQIAPEPIALLASKLIDHDIIQIRTIAQQFRDELSVFQTKWSETGYWQTAPMAEEFSKSQVAKLVSRLGWQLLLTGEYRERLPQFGSHSLRLLHHLKGLFPERSRSDWRQVFFELETDLVRIEEAFSQGPGLRLRNREADFKQFKQLRDNFRVGQLRSQIELKIVRTLRLEV